MNILLVEDDATMAANIELLLRSEGTNVVTTPFGEDAVAQAKTGGYDIILLDLQLPDMHGSDVLRSLRNAKIDTPVLILSGTLTVGAKVEALKGGADDFMTKPFHKDEFIARVQAIIRRTKGHSQSLIAVGNLTVNLDAKTLDVKGQRVNLTGKEYQIMELLAVRKGATISKEALLDHLYGGMDVPEMKIIDVFICKLRTKLEEFCPGENYIETVWSRGYMLRMPESKPAALCNAA